MAIRPIDTRSVHQITSAQVAVDLTSCVKELVENSLDANAGNIEVKFKKYGLEGLEVVDNGDGIDSHDFANVTKKYHTSKIETFDQLDTVMTFGFRGEAMSSLCGISDVSMITCTQDRVPKATKLEYDRNGDIKLQETSAGKKGTTVILTNILSTLPVRRREFEKNYKREYQNALSILQEFAIISMCRITVSNVANGKKSIIFNSSGTGVKPNIKLVYGQVTAESLVQVKFKVDWSGKSILAKMHGLDTRNADMDLEGYISRPVFGQGRQSKDRQFIFVNSRPCKLPRIAKAMTEIYRNYNATEYPFIAVNLKTDPSNYDVNVSPDKRDILLHHEDELVEKIKEQLVEFFDQSGHSVPQSSTVLKTPLVEKSTSLAAFEFKNISKSSPTPSLHSRPSSTRSHDEIDVVDDDDRESQIMLGSQPHAAEDQESETVNESTNEEHDSTIKQAPPVASQIVFDQEERNEILHRGNRNNNQFKKRKISKPINTVTLEKFGFGVTNSETNVDVSSYAEESQSESESELISESEPEQGSDHESQTYKSSRANMMEIDDFDLAPEAEEVEPLGEDSSFKPSDVLEDAVDGPVQSQIEQSEHSYSLLESMAGDTAINSNGVEVDHDEDLDKMGNPEMASGNSDKDSGGGEAEEVDHEHEHGHHKEGEYQQGQELLIEPHIDSISTASFSSRLGHIYGKNRYGETLNHRAKINCSMDLIRKRRKIRESIFSPTETSHMTKSDIQDSDQEEQLRLTINKSDFNNMAVVGQFNKGFILVTKKTPERKDLFIVDQHASDEIFNFEDLQANVKMGNQPLAAPRPLQLTPVDEITVSTHLETIEKNGFRIGFDEEALPGSKCRLLSVPVSKNTKLDEKDLTELIYKIEQSPRDANIKCSKLRAMFAMRACRKSIMIGQSLDVNTMHRVIRHLATLDKPWNCPHGRPTLRHLMTIK